MEEQTTCAEGQDLSALTGALPESSSLTDMVCVMILDRERREKEFAQQRELEIALKQQWRDRAEMNERGANLQLSQRVGVGIDQPTTS